jgi:predicted GNAT family acetyltransferase
MASAANNVSGGAHPLDRVVWNALTSKQRRFATGDERALRFPAPVAPFAAMANDDSASFEAVRGLIDEHGPVALVTTAGLPVPSGFAVLRDAVLLQMVWQGDVAPAAAVEYVQLTERDVPDMVNLTNATQPGPFGPRTIELGDYYGMRSDGKLAAMAGERMRLDGFTEISAVCVDDSFRGQGHAAGLVKWLISTIHARGETPFLHVIASNEAAIALYLRLGFAVRREMRLTVLGA